MEVELGVPNAIGGVDVFLCAPIEASLESVQRAAIRQSEYVEHGAAEHW